MIRMGTKISLTLPQNFTKICFRVTTETQGQLESSQSPQVPPPKQSYSPGGVTIFALPAVPLIMPPLTQW